MKFQVARKRREPTASVSDNSVRLHSIETVVVVAAAAAAMRLGEKNIAVLETFSCYFAAAGVDAVGWLAFFM